MDIEKHVVSILCVKLGIPAVKNTVDQDIIREIDSADRVELITMEEGPDVTIPDEVGVRMLTAPEAVRDIEARIKVQSAQADQQQAGAAGRRSLAR